MILHHHHDHHIILHLHHHRHMILHHHHDHHIILHQHHHHHMILHHHHHYHHRLCQCVPGFVLHHGYRIQTKIKGSSFISFKLYSVLLALYILNPYSSLLKSILFHTAGRQQNNELQPWLPDNCILNHTTVLTRYSERGRYLYNYYVTVWQLKNIDTT